MKKVLTRTTGILYHPRFHRDLGSRSNLERAYELAGDRCRFRCGLSEPGFEARFAESRVIAG
jgi:hypothetical protein